MVEWIQHPESTVHVAVYVAAAVIAVSMVAVSKGGFAGGVGMLAVPLMMQVAPPHAVLGMWLPILLVCDFFTLRQYPTEWNPRAMWLIAPGAVVGILAGWTVLSYTAGHEHWLKLIIGVICLAFVAQWLVRSRFEAAVAEKPAWTPGWSAGWLVGIIGGVTTTLAHAAGPVTTMYLLPQKMDQRHFVGTAARFYLLLNMTKTPLFLIGALVGAAGAGASGAGAAEAAEAASGAWSWLPAPPVLISWPVLKASFWTWLICPPAVWLGSWLNRKISPERFVKLIYIFLALGGGKLIYDGLRAALAAGAS